MDEAVKLVFDNSKGRSGSPRLVRDLTYAGHTYDRKTVASSMRRQGLRAKAARNFKATTNSKHNLPVAPNLLQQDFSATAPNQKFVGDITYFWTDEGWLYLATIIDLYSRLVVGWAMSERMSAEGNCYDNACAESFFHSLKVEAIHGERFATQRRCDKRYSSTSKWTTIEPADTPQTAISARKRLKQNKSLKDVSLLAGRISF